MICVNIALDGEGILKSCRIEGHAGAGAKGYDIVCAAVSVLARTAVRVLEAKHCISVRSEAPARGQLFFDIERGGKGRGFVEAVGSYLLEGLRSVAEEYPDNCKIYINNEK